MTDMSRGRSRRSEPSFAGGQNSSGASRSRTDSGRSDALIDASGAPAQDDSEDASVSAFDEVKRSRRPVAASRPITATRPVAASQPGHADKLRSHADRLLDQGSKLSALLREAQAPVETELARKRVREALPAVLKAIDLSVSGLGELSGGGIGNEYERHQWEDALSTVQGLEWSSLFTDRQWHGEMTAAEAVGELWSCLDQLTGSASLGASAAERARVQLLQLRAQVVAAQRETGELSIARFTGVLDAMARIVRTIAVGLLAAAATGISQGGGIASQVLAAAVGLAVSAICAEACRIARSLWHPPTVGTLLDDAHHDLVYAVNDLSYFLRRLEPGSAPAEHDRQLVRATQFAALANTHHAKYLAEALVWPEVLNYSARLDTISDLLGQIPTVVASGNGTHALAASLADSAQTLARFSIPTDAPVHHLAPDSLQDRTLPKGSHSHSVDLGETI